MADSVVVTGGSGFIGGHVVAELRRRGLEVVTPPRRDIGPETAWADALHGAAAVVHLAAVAHERAEQCERDADYETLQRVNALGAERLALAAADAGVAHFIFISTIGVHGDETAGVPFSEESALAPKSLYAASKAEAERRLRAVAAQRALPLTILRPTLVYGPGNPGNLRRLLELVDAGWPLPFASVANRRTLTYVGNLADAIAALLAGAVRGETFIVGDAEPVSTPALIAALAAGLKRPARLLPFPPAGLRLVARATGRAHLARRLLGSLEADSGKLARRLGWRAPYSAAQGLGSTAAWYRARVQA